MTDDAMLEPREQERRPSVSIVVATRVPAPRLPAVIDRLFAQDYDGTVEILVVIDGDADVPGVPPPPSLSGTFMRALRTLRNAGRAGLDAAREHGRLRAEGDVLVYCRDDEEWPPDRLRTLVASRWTTSTAQVPGLADR